MFFLVVLAWCARHASGSQEIWDLTHDFSQDSVYWPNSRRFEFVRMEAGLRADGSWYAANDFCAGEHGGTHLDAPYHFSSTGFRVADIPLNHLVLPMYIIDVSSKVNGDPNFVLYKHHIDFMLSVFNESAPALVVFKFGWSRFYGDTKRYLGSGGGGNNHTLNFPGISEEMAKFVVGHKSVVGVGIDTASIDPGSSQNYPAHKTLLQAGLYVLENVRLDEPIPEINCTALVMPMKLKGGSGAPLRLVALCPAAHNKVYSARDFY